MEAANATLFVSVDIPMVAKSSSNLYDLFYWFLQGGNRGSCHASIINNNNNLVQYGLGQC